MIKLETTRLILRNFAMTDINDLYEYMSLESTAKYEYFEPLTYKECMSEIERRIPLENVLAVILKDNGKLIGDVCFSEAEEDRTYKNWL